MVYSLEKIANEFGISKSAVSLIINGKAAENRISPELEAKVKAFCESVNYRPNIHARRMCSKIVHNIGLLINEDMLADSENPFSDQIISEITGGVVLAAAKNGFRVTIQMYHSSMSEEVVFEWLRNKEIDGIIYYGYTFNKAWMNSFLSEKRCVVGIGVEPAEGISTVNINNRESMKELTGHLVKKGRKRFIYLAGAEGYVSSQRFLGMRDSLEENNIPFNEEADVIEGGFSEKKAYEAICGCSIDFDAVICANDDMALGVIRALREMGVSVPEAVSIVGADNIKAVSYTTPRLTTLDNMSTELGKTAFRELFRLINGEVPRKTELKSKIYVRDSI